MDDFSSKEQKLSLVSIYILDIQLPHEILGLIDEDISVWWMYALEILLGLIYVHHFVVYITLVNVYVSVFNLIWWQRLFQEECWSIFEGMTAWTFTFQANSSWIWKTISLNVFSPIWFPWKQIIWNLKLVPPHFSLSLNQTNHNSLASRKKTLDWLINKSQSMWLVLKIH